MSAIINNDNENIDEFEALSLLSGNFVELPPTYYLATNTLEVNELYCRQEVVTVSVSNYLEIKYIHRELFIKRI